MTALAEQLVDDGYQTVQTLGAVYRYMSGMVVPYDRPTDVGLYLEQFTRGAFTASLAEHAAVPLLFGHDRSNINNVIGVAVEWDDAPEGLYASFRVAMAPVAQVAAHHARDGMVTGLSVGFSPVDTHWQRVVKGSWNPDLGPGHMDTAVRTSARLHEVSLTPTPAYATARVMAVQADNIT